MKRIIILCIALITTVANAEPKQAPATGGGDVVNTISQQLRLFVAPATRPQEAKELKRLVSAIKAIEDKGVKLTDRRRLRIATAALKASKATGVDAVLLIAIARMESDFRGLQQVDWRCRDQRYSSCRADCGITQHYISGPRAWVVRRCRKLATDYDLSFLKSAQELSRHIQYCQTKQRYNKPLRRCVLNRYNSGTFYRTAPRCRKRWAYCLRWIPKQSWVFAVGLMKPEKQHRYEIYTKASGRCTRVKYRCLARAAYWKTVMCFRYGAQRGIRSKQNCRRMGRCVNRSCTRRWNLHDIPTVFYGKALPTASR